MAPPSIWAWHHCFRQLSKTKNCRGSTYLPWKREFPHLRVPCANAIIGPVASWSSSLHGAKSAHLWFSPLAPIQSYGGQEKQVDPPNALRPSIVFLWNHEQTYETHICWSSLSQPNRWLIFFFHSSYLPPKHWLNEWRTYHSVLASLKHLRLWSATGLFPYQSLNYVFWKVNTLLEPLHSPTNQTKPRTYFLDWSKGFPQTIILRIQAFPSSPCRYSSSQTLLLGNLIGDYCPSVEWNGLLQFGDHRALPTHLQTIATKWTPARSSPVWGYCNHVKGQYWSKCWAFMSLAFIPIAC